MWIFFVVCIILIIGIKKLLSSKAAKNEGLGTEYINNLMATGFQINKQVILSDFLPKIDKMHAFVLGTKMGIFVDYNAKKLAIRSSDTTTPTVISFSDLQDCELLEGNRVESKGSSGVGYTATSMADNLSVRIYYGGGTSGVNAIKIPLYFQNHTGIKLDINSTTYQGCIECARAIIDEIGNIKRLTQSETK